MKTFLVRLNTGNSEPIHKKPFTVSLQTGQGSVTHLRIAMSPHKDQVYIIIFLLTQ